MDSRFSFGLGWGTVLSRVLGPLIPFFLKRLESAKTGIIIQPIGIVEAEPFKFTQGLFPLETSIGTIKQSFLKSAVLHQSHGPWETSARLLGPFSATRRHQDRD
jgi:hypothetical protein